MVELVQLSKSAARKTKQVVTEYLSRTAPALGPASPVRFDQPKLGKTMESIAAGESGRVQVHYGHRDGAVKGEETASGEEREFTCYSRDHDFAADEWCIIIRLGGTGLEIIPFSGGGGGGGGIWVMSIVELVSGCACRVAWCLILRTPCGDNRWLPGDLVAVYDDIECVLNDTEDRLAGVKVIVSRTEGDAYTANALGAECNPDGYDPPEPGSCHFTFVRRCCLEPL